MIVVVGERVMFDPFECDRAPIVPNEKRFWTQSVVGEIVEVNYKHKWFSVEYGCPALRTSFNFSDIGKLVKVCGH